MAAILPPVQECCADQCQQSQTIDFNQITARPYVMMFNIDTGKLVPARIRGSDGAETWEFGTEEVLTTTNSASRLDYITMINPDTFKVAPARIRGSEGAEYWEFGTEEPL